MEDTSGEFTSGVVAGRSVEQDGRNQRLMITLELDGGVGQQKRFVLAPHLSNLDVTIRSHLHVRYRGNMVLEILSIDGTQLTHEHLTREAEIKVPSSVTAAAVVYFILGPLLIVNAMVNNPMALGFMIMFALAMMGAGYAMYHTVHTMAAMAAFILNLFAMMVWIIGPYGYTGPAGAFLGLATIILQSTVCCYFMCPSSMRAYER